ncbi:MAG TPA: hypothetical protein VMT79_21175 [Candidatus Binatia bacterium]|nr:hypothetical protein [Candidatus Binatia bacterium]
MTAGLVRGRAAVAVIGMLAAACGAARETPVSAQAPSTPAAAAPASAASEVELVRERAAAFWEARVAGDSKGQWELLEPRGRNRTTPREYGAARGAVKYIAYQVEDATIEGSFATVKVRLLVQALPSVTMQQRRRIAPQGALVSDRWIRVGGIWYRSTDQERPFPDAQ